MNPSQRARISKAHTEEFLRLLVKEYLFLKEQDAFKADILLQILKNQPYELEELLQILYQYEIDLVLRESAKKVARKALEHYDRPNWVIRGRDEFEEIYDDLKKIYGVGKTE